MGWRDRLLNAKPETVGRAMKFGGGRILSQQDMVRPGMNKGGRVGLERGSKGPIQKIGEAISRKWRGKEKTEHKGLEQDVKTGAYTHKAPKDRWDTKPGRILKGIYKGPRLRPGQKLPTLDQPKNEQTYAELKKKKKVRLKEEKRKKAFDKKHGVK